MSLQIGQTAEVSNVVEPGDTALARGSGDVEVLATPTVVAWCEAAAVKVVAHGLEDDQTSVGVRLSVDHLAPTTVGRTVVARASLESVDGRRLEFVVEAADDAGVIAKGLHTRVIVDRTAFLDGAKKR